MSRQLVSLLNDASYYYRHLAEILEADMPNSIKLQAFELASCKLDDTVNELHTLLREEDPLDRLQKRSLPPVSA